MMLDKRWGWLYCFIFAMIWTSAFNIPRHLVKTMSIADDRALTRAHNHIQASPGLDGELDLSETSVFFPLAMNAYPDKGERLVVFEAFLRPT